MDYELVLRALKRHVDTTQKAVDFYRERQMGRQYAETMLSLNTAVKALREVEDAYFKSRLH
jgi:hypothetical protein